MLFFHQHHFPRRFLINLRVTWISLSLTFSVNSTVWTEERWRVKGEVRQAGTREALAGFTVCLKELPETCGVSDGEGRFSIALPAPGTYTAVIKNMTEDVYYPAAFTVTTGKPSADVVVYCQTDVISLPPLVVSAEKGSDRLSGQAISGEELRQVPGTLGDPLKALQSLPGVAVGSDASSNPAIRGSRPEDNLYYVNDRPVGYLFHMGDLFSVFNADLVDSFDIHASAFGPEYDSALGAVIDVKLREPRADRLGAKFNISALESDVLVEGPVNPDQSFLVAGRRSYLDLLLSNFGDSDEVKVIQFPEFYDYQGKYLWKLGRRHSLAFETSGAWDQLEIEIKNDSDIAAKDPELAGRFGQSQNYHSQGLTWDADILPALTNRLVATHLAGGFDLTAQNLGTGRVNNNVFVLYDALSLRTLEDHDVTLGFRHTYGASDVDFDIQVDFPSEFDPDSDFTSAERKQLRTNVYSNISQVFLKDRWRALPRLTLLAGGRATYDDFVEESHVEPWAGLEFQALEKTTLTAGWGTYHQAPPPYELVEPFGNPRLRSAKARHTVAGVRQKVSGGWSVQVEGYVKTFEDLSLADPDVNYVNGASGRAQGLELLAKKERLDRWSGWLAASQSHSRRRNDITGQEINFANDQPWILNAVGTFWVNKKFSVGVNWRYHTGQPWTPVIGTYVDGTGRIRPLYAEVGSSRLPDYHRMDVRFNRDFVFKKYKMSAYLDLINAYGRRNVSGYSYTPDYSQNEPVYQLPFFPSFGLTAEF